MTRLHDEVYARLPHGRLALTGGPGAGKTGPMILLLLAALDWRARLACRHRDRVRFIPLLEDAADRQVLRQAGVTYQFRHATLQDRLAAYRPPAR